MGTASLGGAEMMSLLRTSSQVQFGLFLLSENAGRFAYILSARSTPTDVARLLLMENPDLVAIHNKKLLAFSLFGCNGSVKPLVHTVVLELIHHVLEVHKGVIHCLHLYLWVGDRRPKHQAADAAKAVDPHGGRHGEQGCARSSGTASWSC